jgi:glycosyltransferase involved in cell wall biosynthesis
LVEDNPQNIADSIIKLLKDKELQSHLKKNAADSIIDYDFKKITREKLIPIYKNLTFAK